MITQTKGSGLEVVEARNDLFEVRGLDGRRAGLAVLKTVRDVVVQ